MNPTDWEKLDKEYREYCHQCQTNGKPPVDFHTWLLGQD
jgi:hypothetical protein